MAESLSEVSSSMEGLEVTEEGKSPNETLMTRTRFTVYGHQAKELSLIKKTIRKGRGQGKRS